MEWLWLALYVLASAYVIWEASPAGWHKIPGGDAVAGFSEHLGLPPTAFRLIGLAEVAGSFGLVAGFFNKPLGIAAAAGLTLLFIGAALSHVKAKDGWGGAKTPTLIAIVAALALVFRILATLPTVQF